MARLLGQRRECILQHFDWKKGGLRQRLCRRRSGRVGYSRTVADAAAVVSLCS
jgi:hypothetical protein